MLTANNWRLTHKMKNIDRLQELNNCLLKKSFELNYQSFSAHLADKYDVINYSERSFNRDIKELKERVAIRFPQLEIEYGQLIRYARSSNRYHYVRSDISAFSGFSEKELSQISHSIDQNRHLFTDGLGQGILQKLQAIGLENRLSRFHQDIKWPVLQLVKDGERSGGQWLEFLLEKIYKQEVVEIAHKGLKKSSAVKHVKGLPLMIKEYNNGWYTGWYVLFYPIKGDNSLIRPRIDDLWCFALDRIVDLKIVKENFQIRLSNDFNPVDYFEHIIGIFRKSTINFKLHEVLFKIQKDSWIRLYLEKYPLHNSQELHYSETECLVKLRVELTNDLENFIFQYLDEIQVLEPKELKNDLNERIQKIQNQ